MVRRSPAATTAKLKHRSKSPPTGAVASSYGEAVEKGRGRRRPERPKSPGGGKGSSRPPKSSRSPKSKKKKKKEATVDTRDTTDDNLASVMTGDNIITDNPEEQVEMPVARKAPRGAMTAAKRKKKKDDSSTQSSRRSPHAQQSPIRRLFATITKGNTTTTEATVDPQKSQVQSVKGSVMAAKIVSVNVKKSLDEFVDSVTTKGVRGIRKEFGTVAKYPQHMSTNAYNANMDRNRYDNVACLDDTRCVLTLNVPPDSDYIHANWVKASGVDIKFIATQAPLTETTADFWRLCYQEAVSSIVNLCNMNDMHEDKCVQYWPLEVNAQVTYGCMQVQTTKVEREAACSTYTLKVTVDGFLSAVVLKLIHMPLWPDKGVPKKFTLVMMILRRLTSKGPCVVHCSAGIGRTGTAIAIEMMRSRLLKGLSVDTLAVLEELRTKRAQSVQTVPQHLYAVCAVLDYIKMKVPVRYDARIIQFQQESSKYLK